MGEVSIPVATGGNGGLTAAAKLREKPHDVYLEELIAHLTGQHGCSLGGTYVQAVQQEAMETAARFAPTLPDGTKRVEIDGGKILAEGVHRRMLERLHVGHSHDYDGAGVPVIVHDWMEVADG